MVRKKATYALSAALVLMPLVAVHAADANTDEAVDTASQKTESSALALHTTTSTTENAPDYEADDAAVEYNQNTAVSMNTMDNLLNPPIKVVRRGTPKATDDPATLPVRVDADSMYYSDLTGNVVAVGTVEAHQGNRELYTDKLLGNSKSQDYTTEGPFRFLEDKGRTKDITGADLQFNSGTNAMTAPDVVGFVKPYYVKAEKAEFDGNTGLITNGWLTSEHAMAYKGVPDYRIEGTTIEVYPGDKAIVNNAKFFIKNGKILSMPRYVVSLRKDESKLNMFSFIPRPTYNSDDGFGLKGNIEYPIGEHGELFYTYQWMTKEGFKPSYGYRHYFPWGGMRFGVSRESSSLNARTVWVEKRPEFSVYTNTYHIGSTPFTVRGEANIGYWKENYIKGSHNMFKGELSHNTIRPTKNTSLRFYAGYQRDQYGYNDLTRSMPYWGANASWRINSKITAWTSYKQHNIDARSNSPYPFDRIDIRRNWTTGFSVQVSRLDRLSVSLERDVQSGELRYVDYTWYRDMHSFEGWLTYQSKQKKWSYTIVAKDF